MAIEPEAAPTKTTANTGWTYLRYAVALLLFVAAITKIVTTPQVLASDGLLASLPRLAGVIALEAAAATYLLLGPLLWSWRLTVLLFTVFIGSTAYAISTGKSCGCFGEQLSPQVMLGIDIAVLVLALVLRPRQPSGAGPLVVVHLIACAVIGMSLAGASLWRHQTVDRTAPLEFLLADTLTGQSWPLNVHWHPNLQPLGSGRWLVLVVRHDCDHCRQLVQRYFSDPSRHRDGERTAVFVAGSSSWPFQLDHVSFDSVGDDSITWPSDEPFVASPAIFLLDDAVITEAADGDDSDAFMEQLFEASGTQAAP